MPIYEYKCNKCGVFEVMQKITDSPLKKCPTCKGKAERQISNTSFVLKGSGWYVTDYARKGAKSDSTESSTNGTSTAKDGASKDTSASASTSPSDSSSASSSDKSSTAKSSSDKSSSEKSTAKPAA
jgi:putative FmdB family regulatory protein